MKTVVKHITNGPDVLRALLLLMLFRRVYEDGVDYETMAARYPALAVQTFAVHFSQLSHTIDGSIHRTLVYQVPTMTLLMQMKVNLEQHDFCTRLQRQLLRSVNCNDDLRWMLVLSMVFFGSRMFLTALQSACDSGVDNKVVVRLIRRSEQPARLFTPSFNPNRIRRNQIRKMQNASHQRLATEHLWKKFLTKARSHLNLDVSRRYLSWQLSSRMGSFSGKNCFQLCRLAWPSAPVFARQLPNNKFTLTGPGARSAINQFRGWPQTWNLYRRDSATADVYNQQLILLREQFKSICAEILARGSYMGVVVPPELAVHIKYFASGFYDEVRFQFLLCELSKILNYIQTGNRTYRRGATL